MAIFNIIESLRPKQWTKNLILFVGLLFSEQNLIFRPMAWVWGISGFFLFSMISGTVYMINDLLDIEQDRLHPKKCMRPIASGRVSKTQALCTITILLLVTFCVAFMVSSLFFSSSVAYFLLNLAYSLKLKQVVLLDVLCISLGFVMRAQAGIGILRPVDSNIYMSHWLLLCTLTLALFLALAKRRQEIVLLQDSASSHRSALIDYTPAFIDQMLSIAAAITIVSYALYTVSVETVAKFGTHNLVMTVPIVIYGVFRYLYLIHIRKLGDNPSELLLKDVPIQLTIVLWLLVVSAVIHFNISVGLGEF